MSDTDEGTEVQLNPEELQKWGERLQSEVNDKQYWKKIVEFLLLDEELEEDDGKCLQEFINSEEAEFLFDKEMLRQEEKEKRVIELLKRLDSLKERRKEDEKAAVECETADFVQEYYEAKKKHGGNEDIYKDEFYRKAKKYLVFYYMLASKCKVISDKFEKRVCYQRYGKITMYGNYYNESVVRDLVISNVSRGLLYKRNPKNLCNKAKYEYGKDASRWRRPNYFIE